MSTTEQIREAIATTLETVTDIGVVHRYERYAHQAGPLAALYGWEGQLRGWHIRRVAVSESRLDTAPEIVTRWEIRGYLALADAAETELTMDALIDAARAAFRADPTLGGTVATTAAEGVVGLQLADSGPVLFGGVLCHKAVLTLNTRQYGLDE